MKIIIPMAGRGTRLRPHTLTVPKPLVPVAGKPIVAHLVKDLTASYEGKVEEIAFIIGDFGQQVEADLKELAASVGAKGHIFHQKEKLGTAHAILEAKACLDGPVIVAFADTLFKASFTLDTEQDGVIWAQRVEDPSAFGVLQLNEEGYIEEFVEKPQEFVSDLAIVGIYYFKDGLRLRKELQYLINNKIMDRGEYQLTDALENMKNAGLKFTTAEIEEWLDCGNKEAVVYANQRVLEIKEDAATVDASATIENSQIIPPCFIAAGAVIRNSVVGPHVSIGEQTVVEQSVVRNSLLQGNTKVQNVVLENSMLGNCVSVLPPALELSYGDYTKH